MMIEVAGGGVQVLPVDIRPGEYTPPPDNIRPPLTNASSLSTTVAGEKVHAMASKEQQQQLLQQLQCLADSPENASMMTRALNWKARSSVSGVSTIGSALDGLVNLMSGSSSSNNNTSSGSGRYTVAGSSNNQTSSGSHRSTFSRPRERMSLILNLGKCSPAVGCGTTMTNSIAGGLAGHLAAQGTASKKESNKVDSDDGWLAFKFPPGRLSETGVQPRPVAEGQEAPVHGALDDSSQPLTSDLSPVEEAAEELVAVLNGTLAQQDLNAEFSGVEVRYSFSGVDGDEEGACTISAEIEAEVPTKVSGGVGGLLHQSWDPSREDSQLRGGGMGQAGHTRAAQGTTCPSFGEGAHSNSFIGRRDIRVASVAARIASFSPGGTSSTSSLRKPAQHLSISIPDCSNDPEAEGPAPPDGPVQPGCEAAAADVSITIGSDEEVAEDSGGAAGGDTVADRGGMGLCWTPTTHRCAARRPHHGMLLLSPSSMDHHRKSSLMYLMSPRGAPADPLSTPSQRSSRAAAKIVPPWEMEGSETTSAAISSTPEKWQLNEDPWGGCLRRQASISGVPERRKFGRSKSMGGQAIKHQEEDSSGEATRNCVVPRGRGSFNTSNALVEGGPISLLLRAGSSTESQITKPWQQEPLRAQIPTAGAAAADGSFSDPAGQGSIAADTDHEGSAQHVVAASPFRRQLSRVLSLKAESIADGEISRAESTIAATSGPASGAASVADSLHVLENAGNMGAAGDGADGVSVMAECYKITPAAQGEQAGDTITMFKYQHLKRQVRSDKQKLPYAPWLCQQMIFHCWFFGYTTMSLDEQAALSTLKVQV